MHTFFLFVQKMRNNPTALIVSLSVLLTALRFFIVNPADIAVLRNEEVSIYLHAAEKSFFKLFMMPDSNYINLINKFCAVIALKGLKAFDEFAQVQNILNWFFAALCSSFFLTKRFDILIASWKVRLALCFYLYLLPIQDFYMVFSQGYYLVFILLFYFLALSDKQALSSREIVVICVTAPFAVFSKPVFFVFGFAFLGILFMRISRCIRHRRTLDAHSGLLVYLLALYAFQAWFTITHYSYMDEFAHHLDKTNLLGLLFFLGKKIVIFLGYGLVCPLAHILPPNAANALCFISGLAVAGTILANCVAFCRNRQWIRLVTLGLFAASSLLSLYGAISVDFLYQRYFIQDIFAVQWSQRMIFPVILLALFSCAFWVQRLRNRYEKISIALIWALCATSYCISSWNFWNTGYLPSFTWEQTRPLLEERYPFIPHAYGMEFYYMRGLQFVSTEMPLKITGRATLAAPDVAMGKKVHYFVLKQKPGSDALALSPSDALMVRVGEVEYKARLVNPGQNEQYLFKFNGFVPSEAFREFHVAAREISLPGRALSGYIIGF